jgi:multicomponent Na+:H+ antiporter subunit E
MVALMFALRVVLLTAVYLLSLTSLALGDVLVGFLLATVLVALLRLLPYEKVEPPSRRLPERLVGVPSLIGGSLLDLARGSWQVGRCCLRGRLPAPGFVEVGVGAQSPSSSAIWGIRTGLSPDSVVVDVDPTAGTLLLHVLDASDPDAVRANEQRTFARRQRRVFPA